MDIADNNDPALTFTKLYSEVYSDLYYYALSRLGDPDNAEDAVSEAVLDAYKGFRKLRDYKRFKSWIFKILDRKLKYIYRELRRRPEESDRQEVFISDFSGVEVLDALKVLNENERTVFSLSVINNMTSQEISEITGMNSSTVRSHLLRARKKLRTDQLEHEIQ